MKTKTEKKMDELYDQGNLGYAYLFPKGSEQWNERLTFHLSPENIANVFMGNGDTAGKVVVTDMLDRLVCDSMVGGFLNQCPDQDLCKEVVGYLIPLQRGEREVQEVLSVTEEEMNKCMRAEEERVMLCELSML